jgi:3-hydroxyisobutyrate dehydrogenase
MCNLARSMDAIEGLRQLATDDSISDMLEIGFIGLGAMGRPMASVLAKNGHRVRGYDISEAVRSAIAASNAGIEIAESAQQACSESAVVITMVPNGEVLADIFTGAQGVFDTLRPGTLVIDSSTVDLETTMAMHRQAGICGITYADAPVSGGVKGAENANLTIMIGANKDAYELAAPILSLLGERVVHVGGPGAGQSTKMLNQMLFATNLVAVSELFLLGARLNIDPHILYDVVTNSSGDCWALRNFCPWPGIANDSSANEEYKSRFAARHMSKDLGIALQAAESIGYNLAIAETVAGLFKMLASQDPSIDIAAVIRALPEFDRTTVE